MSNPKYIHVRVTTKSRKESITPSDKKDTYLISVKEKAELGLANARVKELLVQALHCNPSHLRLVKGGTSPSKTFLLNNT